MAALLGETIWHSGEMPQMCKKLQQDKVLLLAESLVKNMSEIVEPI